jgi:hypothetical protein
MTIREYLRRRVVLVRPVSTVCSVACFVLFLFWQDDRHSQTDRNTWLSLGVMGVLALAIGVQLLSQSRLKCPSCHQSLSKIALVFAWTKDKPAACPHCGVNFDDPMPTSNDWESFFNG